MRGGSGVVSCRPGTCIHAQYQICTHTARRNKRVRQGQCQPCTVAAVACTALWFRVTSFAGSVQTVESLWSPQAPLMWPSSSELRNHCCRRHRLYLGCTRLPPVSLFWDLHLVVRCPRSPVGCDRLSLFFTSLALLGHGSGTGFLCLLTIRLGCGFPGRSFRAPCPFSCILSGCVTPAGPGTHPVLITKLRLQGASPSLGTVL